MPRILFNMPSQFAGRSSGVALVAFGLLGALLRKSDFEYLLRSPWSREQLPRSLRTEALGVITVPRPSILLLDVIRQSLVLPKLCRREGIDLIVNLDPFGTAAGGRARLMIVHDLYFRSIPEQIGRKVAFTNDLIFRMMILGNSEMVTVSDATRHDLEFWYPSTRGRSTTIHSASSLSPIPGGTGPPGIPGRYVLAVGNATKNKNFRVLAEAMTKIHGSFPDVALVHVGDDPNEIMAKTLESSGSQVKLIRMGGISDEQLARLYGGASCLCVPSLYEGFCLPVLEAQILGCPVVCANRSATPEIAGDGALLFDPTDSNELANCLRTVISDTDISDELIRRGHVNASKFSWDVAVEKYETIFRRVIASH